MATLREYFDTDFRHTQSVTRSFRLEWRQTGIGIVPSDNQLRIGGPGEILALGIPNTTDSKRESSVGVHGHVHQAVPSIAVCDTGASG